MCYPCTYDSECNKACNPDEHLVIKNCLIDKVVLACEDEILNITEASIDDKKVTCKKVIAIFTLFHW